MTEQEFEVLVEKNYDYLLRYAESLCENKEYGVDLLHQTLEYQIRHIKKIDYDGWKNKQNGFKAYVSGKILLFSKDLLFTWAQYDEVPEEFLGYEPNIQDTMRIDIENAVASLREDLRIVAVFYLQGYTESEIGRKLNYSQRTASTKWQKAQYLLQQLLSCYRPKTRC